MNLQAEADPRPADFGPPGPAQVLLTGIGAVIVLTLTVLKLRDLRWISPFFSISIWALTCFFLVLVGVRSLGPLFFVCGIWSMLRAHGLRPKPLVLQKGGGLMRCGHVIFASPRGLPETYEPWSKLVIRGLHRDYVGSFLKGYKAVYEELGAWLISAVWCGVIQDARRV